MSDERERLQIARDEALQEANAADKAIVNAKKKADAASLEEDEARMAFTQKLLAFSQAQRALRDYDEKHKQEGER